MNFERKILTSLNEWKKRKNHKPLILRGARQVGKTTLIKQFSKSFKHYIYLNLEKESDKTLFENNNDVKHILDTIFLKENIPLSLLNETLIFIDEIQESPKAIQLLRYFYEDVSDIHIIAAGSLLEFSLKNIKNLPVGRVEFLYMYPFNFEEFLNALKKTELLREINEIPLKPHAHQTLLEIFNLYTIIGGMPEIVKEYALNQSISDLQRVYESIWETYKNDIEKYSKNETERKIIKHILNVAQFSIEERIKFQNFGNSNYKSREVGEAFRHLDDAKIILLIYPTTETTVPIKVDMKKSPKIQFLDTGILNYSLGIQSTLLGMEDLSNSYKGKIIPHIVFQELISLNELSYEKPCFWVREKKQSNSEIDLVINFRDKMIPIEIKSGKKGTLRSLHQFMESSNHVYAVRIFGEKFSIDRTTTPNGKEFLLMNLPYYLTTKIKEYLTYFIDNHKI